MARWAKGEDALRLALRLYISRSVWKPSAPAIVASRRNRSPSGFLFAHVCRKRQSHASLGEHSVTSSRYYSQGGILNEGLQEKKHPSIPQSPVPTEIQSSESHPGATQKKITFNKQLSGCSSPSDVLDLLSHFSATGSRISNCLRRMWETTKKMSEDQRRHELQLMSQHPQFQGLLQNTMKCARNMHSDDLAYSFLATVKLGVSQRSHVVQTLLRVCQENINKFDDRSLSILASCLQHMENVTNVIALKEGLRLSVYNRLPSISNVYVLQTMMRLAGKDAPLDLKRKLERKALSMKDHFNLPNSQRMISTMASMGFRSKPLLDICSEKIAENLHGVAFTSLFGVLKSYRELYYRHLALFQGISSYVASTVDTWSNKQLILFLHVFEDLAFRPAAIMEAFAERVMEHPDALTPQDLLSVLKSYSSLNHAPRHGRQKRFFDSLSHALESYLYRMSVQELLKAVYYLCVMGHVPSTPLEHLVQKRWLDQLATTSAASLRSQEARLRMVDLCLRLDSAALPRPLTLPPSLLGDPAPADPPLNPHLSPCLREAAGGEARAALREAVLVENVHVIDFLITKALPATEGSIQSEWPPAPAESSQRIAVICAAPSDLCYGTSHPRGNLAVKIRHLGILGYTPVVIMESELVSLSEAEKAALLRVQIFSEHHGSDARPTEK